MSDFSETRYRAVINFLTLENVQLQQIHNCMIAINSNNVPLYAMVSHWAREFHRGRTSFEDLPRPGFPLDAAYAENGRAVENITLQKHRVNMQQIVETVYISHRLVRTIFHEHVLIATVYARWVRKCLTRKCKVFDPKHQMKIWNSYSWTGIC